MSITRTTDIIQTPTTQRGDEPGRVPVRTYDRYEDAQAAVDHLSDEGFPVEHVSIVSEGLRMVEHVTGRRRYGRAAGEGAVNGAVIGALIGFVVGLFSMVDPLVSGFALAATWLVVGAVAGAVVGVAAQAMTRGRRDFASESFLAAERYVVLVDDQVRDEAERTLATQG